MALRAERHRFDRCVTFQSSAHCAAILFLKYSDCIKALYLICYRRNGQRANIISNLGQSVSGRYTLKP